LSLLEVKGPLECGACTSSGGCGEYWQATCTAWGRSDCDAPPPASGGAPSCPSDADAGANSGGAESGPAEPRGGAPSGAGSPSQGGVLTGSAGATPGGAAGDSTPAPSAGCGCRAAGSPHNSGLAACALLGMLVVWRRCARLLLPVLALAGCGTNADPTPKPDEGEECTGDFDVFEPGMTQLAEPGEITVELTNAEPSPPVVRRDNVWWLTLTDTDGNPISSATLLASPYMPKHQHGSAEVVVEDLGEGEYRLSPIELIMPGVWEIPLSVTPADGEASETSFRFCIAER
jgi:MYXO-CTERM domain-containing protein